MPSNPAIPAADLHPATTDAAAPSQPATYIPTCPRCGYDLRGQAPAASAPTDHTGTCAECGVEFRWREVLDPALASPRWFIESALSRWGLVRTFFRSLIPNRFFREVDGVRLTTPARVTPRLRFFVIILLLLVLGVWIIPVAAAAWSRSSLPANFRDYGQELYFWPLGQRLGEWGSGLYRDWRARQGQGMWSSPASFLATREYAYLLWVCLLWVVLTPAGLLLLRTTRRVCKVRTGHIARAGVYSIGGAALIIGVWFGLLAAAMMIEYASRYTITPRTRGAPFWAAAPFFAYHNALAVFPLLGAWLLWWWWLAIGRYMKLPSTPAVALTMVFMAFLGGAAIVTVLASPGPMQEIGDRLDFWLR